MFKVPIDKIIPVTDARAKIASLVNAVQKDHSMYVLTRGGKPAAVLASIEYITDKSKAIPQESEPQKTEIEPYKKTEKLPEHQNVAKDLEKEISTTQLQENVQNENPDDEQPVKISIQ